MIRWYFTGLLCHLLFFIPLECSVYDATVSGKIIHQIYSFHVQNAFEQYSKAFNDSLQHDHHLLQRMASLIISQDSFHPDINKRRFAIWGAGLSATDSLLPILEKSIKSTDPIAQRLALKHLSYYENDQVQALLEKSLSSNSLDVILEIAHLLTLYNNRLLIPRILQIRDKIHPQLFSIFSPFFLQSDLPEAETAVREILVSHNKENKLNILFHISQQPTTIFLPELQNILASPDYAYKESALFILGNVHDQSMLHVIASYLSHHESSVRLAAAVALIQLGQKEPATSVIIQEASCHNLFAIQALTYVDPDLAIPCLYELLTSNNPTNISYNAILALLHHKETNHLHELYPFLIASSEKCSLHIKYSPGKMFQHFDFTSSHNQYAENDGEQITFLKLQILEKFLKASPSLFISFIEQLIHHNCSEILPYALKLLYQKNIPFNTSVINKALSSSNAIIRYAGTLYGCYYDLPKYLFQLKSFLFRESLNPLMTFYDDTTHKLTSEKISCMNIKTSLFLEGLQLILNERNDDAYSFWSRLMLKGHPNNYGLMAGIFLQLST